ncbi:MAG: hypothetical protein Q9162_002627 [Coniocarpon cinnabarinum]
MGRFNDWLLQTGARMLFATPSSKLPNGVESYAPADPPGPDQAGYALAENSLPPLLMFNLRVQRVSEGQAIWLTYPTLIILSLVIYTAGLYIYRIYLSPLSKIPGPRLAAASLFFEGYYDIVKNGRFPWKIHEMHEKYGPVVRINPREVHIADPDFVDSLFSQRLDKDPWFSKSFGVPLSAFTTWDRDLHRQRRGAINPFFSKTSIASRAPLIKEKVLKLCDKLKAAAGSNEVVQMDAALICLTMDIIAELCYGISYNYLDVPGFDKTVKTMFENTFGAGAFNRQAPWALAIMEKLPEWLVAKMNPPVAAILHLQAMVRIQAKRIIASTEAGPTNLDGDKATDDKSSSYDVESEGTGRRSTIFHQILHSKLPPSEKQVERLVQEGQVLLGAGSETTARAIYLSVVHLLKHADLLSRLRQELQTVMPSASSEPTLQQLEQLPFLTAVIKESVRLGGSTATRGARISPQSNPITYKDFVFPAGTPVSVTLMDVMFSPEIFPEPHEFNPFRWLTVEKSPDGTETLKLDTTLDKYFVAFSKGPRSCVGMWLAWTEMYLTMAYVYRRLDLELYETDIEDVAAARDRLSCFAKSGSKGVRVKILRTRED